MTGTLVRPHPGHPGYVYYNCPHNPKNPRHQASAPDHPTTVRVREDDLVQVIEEFFTTRIFGPDRKALLGAQLPATHAEETAQREKETTTLHKRLRQIDAAENAHAREIEHLAAQPANSPAITALRTRIIQRFTDPETERAQINDRLTAVNRAITHADDPTLLDALPTLNDLTGAPVRAEAQLFQAFGLELIYNKPAHQVTIYATITPSASQTLADIIAISEPPTIPTTAAGLALSLQHPQKGSRFTFTRALVWDSAWLSTARQAWLRCVWWRARRRGVVTAPSWPARWA
jgi:site-specific DNA recombinase